MNDPATLAFADLQPEDILATLSDLGFACDGRFLALNSYENRVYQVGIEDERPVVAKFYRPGRWSDDAILEEHAFAAALAAQEIPVVPPLEHLGETLHHSGHHRVAIYECHGGRAPDLDNFELQKQLGRLVARIHLEGETSRFKHRPGIDINTYGTESVEYLLENDFIPDDNRAAYESIIDLVLDGVEACYERAGGVREIRLHGDFHPGNVLVREEQLHIVDLDDARHGPAVQDLWMLLSGERGQMNRQLGAVLAGYETFMDFDPSELRLIEALRTLRMLHHSAWIARRWGDPAFPIAFPWFASPAYWAEQTTRLREQLKAMAEPAPGMP